MQRFTSLNVCGSVTYSDFVLYLEYYLIDECCTGDIDSVWHKRWPETVFRSETYIAWSSDFALYLEDYLMDKCQNWDIGSKWCGDLPHTMYVGQLPTFYGPVILSYILKTVWLRNVILKILIQCGITIDLQIYVCWSLIWLLLNVAKLEIEQLLTAGVRRGHACTLDKVLVFFSFLKYFSIKSFRFIILSFVLSKPLLIWKSDRIHEYTHTIRPVYTIRSGPYANNLNTHVTCMLY